MVRDLAPGTVLEIGCGQGSMGARLAAAGRLPRPSSRTPAPYAVARDRVDAARRAVLPADHTGVPGRLAGTTSSARSRCSSTSPTTPPRWPMGRPGPAGRPRSALGAGVRPPVRPDGRQGRPLPPVRPGRALRPGSSAAGLVESAWSVYGWPLGYALEAVRNRVDARHLAGSAGDATAGPAAGVPTPEERTAASGRHQQPGGGRARPRDRGRHAARSGTCSGWLLTAAPASSPWPPGLTGRATRSGSAGPARPRRRRARAPAAPGGRAPPRSTRRPRRPA